MDAAVHTASQSEAKIVASPPSSTLGELERCADLKTLRVSLRPREREVRFARSAGRELGSVDEIDACVREVLAVHVHVREVAGSDR